METKVNCSNELCKYNKHGKCQKKNITLGTMSGSYDRRDLFCMDFKLRTRK